MKYAFIAAHMAAFPYEIGVPGAWGLKKRILCLA